MSTALLDAVVKKNRVRLIPFMLALYVLAFLDRSNIGFAKQTYHDRADDRAEPLKTTQHSPVRPM